MSESIDSKVGGKATNDSKKSNDVPLSHTVSIAAKRKPDLKLESLPPAHLYMQQRSATQKAGESILEKRRDHNDDDNEVNNQHATQHAHFLENDVAGHAGQPMRGRSASVSDRGIIDTHGDHKGMLRKPSGIIEEELVGIHSASSGSEITVSSTASGQTLQSMPSNSTSTANRSSALGATLPMTAATSSSTNVPGDPRLPQDDGKLHILLGATGSVSTGKLRQIILKLEEIYGKSRISVQIILTKAAENFVSRGEIPSNVRIWRDKDEWETWRGRTDPVVHIELRRWADIFVIAPLSANTLGKIALGLCDNLLTNVVRAWNTQYPILIAPAMSSYAYNHPATKRHLKVIKEDMKWIETLKPTEKVVGSYGDIGLGGMMDWNEIVNRIVMKLGGYPEDQEEEKEEEDDDKRSCNESDEEIIEEDDGIGKVTLADEEEMEKHKKLRETRSFT